MEERINTEYEICICCGKQLDILRSTPVTNREYYIIGAGQLCLDCYCALNEMEIEDSLIIKDSQMEYLIDRCREK